MRRKKKPKPANRDKNREAYAVGQRKAMERAKAPPTDCKDLELAMPEEGEARRE